MFLKQTHKKGITLGTFVAGPDWSCIVTSLGCVLCAAQTALVNARRHLLRDQVERGSHQAHFALEVAEDSTRVLSTFQLGHIPEPLYDRRTVDHYLSRTTNLADRVDGACPGFQQYVVKLPDRYPAGSFSDLSCSAICCPFAGSS